ncbi:YdiK family protein [Siminovitchia sediminis]|uniref:YdiK family protein n=1 Tax=Siminovitchia sediminis TaxID=1274353 RepID=A0ABW4KK56_9BACI
MRSPLFSGIVYILLGVTFTYFAVQQVNLNDEWGFFVYLMILLATFDFGAGIRLVSLHFRLKNQERK